MILLFKRKMVTSEKLQELTRIASESVKDLDTDLKKTAFETILKGLLSKELGESNNNATRVPLVPKKKLKKQQTFSKIKKDNPREIMSNDLINNINRTKYPKIYGLSKALDKAIYVLKLAKEDFDKDGLTPSEISKILTSAFRIKSNYASVSMALMKAQIYVDRKEVKQPNGGITFVYYLMHEGEKYITKVLEETQNE